MSLCGPTTYRPLPEHARHCEGHEALGGKRQVQGEAVHVVLKMKMECDFNLASARLPLLILSENIYCSPLVINISPLFLEGR